MTTYKDEFSKIKDEIELSCFLEKIQKSLILHLKYFMNL